MKTAYQRFLYRQGYQMPVTCLCRNDLEPYHDEVHIFQRPFRYRKVYAWRISHPVLGWVVSQFGYLTASGAMKSGLKALAEMKADNF